MGWFLIADLSGLLSTLWMIGSVAAGLGLVIFVHELGHFLAAKACGVKCEKFYIGFDIPLRLGPIKLPSSLCKFRWGETEYGVGILPLGGYVKMLGQDDDPRNQARENERVRVLKQRQEDAPLTADDSAVGQRTVHADSTHVNRARPEGEEDDFELDPRSFPAKPVWQRMIIISAGVVMNLISAVIFAAIAYQMGVSYTPCVLGGTAPGDPAWVEGIQPGDKIVQIGRVGWFGRKLQPDPYLRFDKDLMINVTLNGADRPMDLLIRPAGKSENEWVEISPSGRLKDSERPATLGVRPAYTTVLDKEFPCDPECKDEEGYAQLVGGDEIIAVDGQVLPRDAETGVIYEYHLEAYLAQHMTDPVTLTVQRKPNATSGQVEEQAAVTPTQLEVTLPPNRLRTLGLIMRVGPIVGVRTGTPADRAGFRAGDVLVAADGQDVGDPFTLAQRLLPSVGEEVEFVVRRGEAGEQVTLQATLEPPRSYVNNFGPGSPVALDCLGIAFEIENVVHAVVPESPAASQGLQAGDKILAVEFLVDGSVSGEPISLVKEDSDGNEQDLPNWAYVHSAMNLLCDSDLVMTYRRDGSEQTVTATPEYSDRWFHPSRRLNTTPLSLVRTAATWSEAFALGYRETKVSLKQVAVVLQRLFTGQISYKSMGGPIMIARAAGAEASRGIARLLVFLTFLSANLAILNFLPIPALDGGHMVFLAAEGIRGKPVNERLQVALTLIGVGCLLSLMVLVFALDIHRLDLLRWIR